MEVVAAVEAAAAVAQAAAVAVADPATPSRNQRPCCCSAAASPEQLSTGDGAARRPTTERAAVGSTRSAHHRWLALCLLMAACEDSPQVDCPCTALVQSPPAQWVETLPPVLALGPPAVGDLIGSLRDAPEAPGRQAALCALGELGNAEAVPFLIEQAVADEAYAYEAALALGRLGDATATAALRDLTTDHESTVTTRTAAACALLDLGASNDAVPLLCAVLLADTPFGLEEGERHGLPSKSQWALERQIAIDAIARYSGGETFGLDPDSSWPRLRDGVLAFRQHLRDR